MADRPGALLRSYRRITWRIVPATSVMLSSPPASGARAAFRTQWRRWSVSKPAATSCRARVAEATWITTSGHQLPASIIFCREAPGLLGKATAPLRSGGGELTTGTRPSASYRGERGSSGSPSGRGGKPDGDTVPAAAGADSGVFPGLLARYHVAQGPGPVSLLASVTTVAQVRTDLQGISHAERNWSD